MNWHERYLHQATWTRELRAYAFEKCGWASARRALEVGCGTGAILRNPGAEGNETSLQPELHGLDISEAALIECRTHAAGAHLTCGDVRSLPYASALFDICYCHFLLLWVDDPLLALGEMKRVTVRSGYVLALAEPDYGARTDKPGELAWLGQRQNESLRNQGAALGRGAELAQLFDQAGIRAQAIRADGLANGDARSIEYGDERYQQRRQEHDRYDGHKRFCRILEGARI